MGAWTRRTPVLWILFQCISFHLDPNHFQAACQVLNLASDETDRAFCPRPCNAPNDLSQQYLKFGILKNGIHLEELTWCFPGVLSQIHCAKSATPALRGRRKVSKSFFFSLLKYRKVWDTFSSGEQLIMGKLFSVAIMHSVYIVSSQREPVFNQSRRLFCFSDMAASNWATKS